MHKCKCKKPTSSFGNKCEVCDGKVRDQENLYYHPNKPLTTKKDIIKGLEKIIEKYKKKNGYIDLVDGYIPLENFIKQEINKAQKKRSKKILNIISKEFWKLEEMEKDFDLNQEIIKTRNTIQNLIDNLTK